MWIGTADGALGRHTEIGADGWPIIDERIIVLYKVSKRVDNFRDVSTDKIIGYIRLPIDTNSSLRAHKIGGAVFLQKVE